MPTNLPPEYYKVEEQYRAARSSEEKVALLEEMLSIIPKHKGTDKLRADLRRRLSKLKTAEGHKKGSRQASPFQIDPEGAGQVVVVGMANVGKSALVTALTNATPEVADYPFTTWAPTPGMMNVGNVQIQLIDTPPLDRDYIEPEFLNLIRRADLVLVVVDLQGFPIEQLEDTAAFLDQHRIVPDHLPERQTGERRLTSVPFLVAVNKVDDEGLDEDMAVLAELLGDEWALVPISAGTGRGLDELGRVVFERLGLIRVYAKPPGREPDLSAPFVLEEGATVAEFAAKVHLDFAEQLKSARVWGTSGVYEGQMVGREHVLHDGDVVELRI